MEMEEIPIEERRGEGAKAQTEEPVETEHYSSLQSPTEDLYAEAKFLPNASETKPGLGHVRLWRGVSLCLGTLCLILILTIVLLVLKRPPIALCQESSPNVIFSKQLAVNFHNRCQSPLCTDGWLHFGDSCFFMSPLRRTWDQAQKNCSEQGGGLAVITNPRLQNFLTQSGKRPFWIGLRHDQSWTWVNKQPLTQSYWSDSESQGNCVLLMGNVPSDKSWMRSSCSRLIYYICEVPVSETNG